MDTPIDAPISTDQPTREEIEKYKADWKRKGFPDLDRGLDRGMALDRGNEHARQMAGEDLLWLAYLRELFADYTGISRYAKEACLGCHAEAGCGHVVNDRVRKGHLRCPNHHTNQECARRIIFESPEFATLLEHLGLDVEYVRKMAKNPANIRTDSLDLLGMRERKPWKKAVANA
jgi:hypothetical protein